MATIIDLSQPISWEKTVPHPAFPKPMLLPFIQHGDPRYKFSSQSEILILCNHASTHIDALRHFDPTPGAPDIGQMELDLFTGEAICVDIRSIPGNHYITVGEFEKILKSAPVQLRPGDILLFCSDHYEKTKDQPQNYVHNFAGMAPEVIRWMKQKGVKLFGMETISCDCPDVTDEYPAHIACREVKLPHVENMCNLSKVVNRRFQFHAFPLKLEGGSASPVRAVAVL
jgi:kynurenine formamidase